MSERHSQKDAGHRAVGVRPRDHWLTFSTQAEEN
jgi:hypothetical protein